MHFKVIMEKGKDLSLLYQNLTLKSQKMHFFTTHHIADISDVIGHLVSIWPKWRVDGVVHVHVCKQAKWLWAKWKKGEVTNTPTYQEAKRLSGTCIWDT